MEQQHGILILIHDNVKEIQTMQSDHKTNCILKQKVEVGNSLVLRCNPFWEKAKWKPYNNK